LSGRSSTVASNKTVKEAAKITTREFYRFGIRMSLGGKQHLALTAISLISGLTGRISALKFPANREKYRGDFQGFGPADL
jgi:hypothetical protein